MNWVIHVEAEVPEADLDTLLIELVEALDLHGVTGRSLVFDKAEQKLSLVEGER